MPQSQPPLVRLASTTTPGAEMYNFYQLISLLSSLYVKSLDRGDDESSRGAWDACSLSILEQIGTAHNGWGKILEQTNTGIPLDINEPLVRRTISLSNRLMILERQLNEWTPAVKWSRIMGRMEHAVAIVGERVAVHHPTVREIVRDMSSMVSTRRGLLGQIEKRAIEESKNLTQNFAEPVAL